MRLSILERLTAWLLLASILFVGITPAQGLVVCIEADGCVSLEIKAPDVGCSGCIGHADEVPASSDEDAACPCTDLAVPGSRATALARARGIELDLPLALAPAEYTLLAHTRAAESCAPEPSRAPPREPPLLEHIQSIVILI